MRAKRALPPIERLNELLEIVEIPEEKYGIWSGLVWKVNRRGTARAGCVAGSLQQASCNPTREDWVVGVDGIDYYASRVIYYMTTGEEPGAAEVDHKDQNWLNNNACNLRLDADRTLQAVNSPKQKNNTSGVVGVCWGKSARKWMSYVKENGKRKHLGYFVCKIKAARVVNEKWIEMGWDKKGRELNDLESIVCNCKNCK